MKIYNHLYNDRQSWFLTQRNEKCRSEKIDIVQIGDSITAGFNIARYLVTNKTIINSGIGGDITDILLQRYERDCLDYQPQTIILMIGINDIRTYFKQNQHIHRTTEEQLISEVSNNIIKLIELSNHQHVVWCQILPINELELNSYYINSVIDKVNNTVLAAIAECNNVEVIKFDQLIICV